MNLLTELTSYIPETRSSILQERTYKIIKDLAYMIPDDTEARLDIVLSKIKVLLWMYHVGHIDSLIPDSFDDHWNSVADRCLRAAKNIETISPDTSYLLKLQAEYMQAESNWIAHGNLILIIQEMYRVQDRHKKNYDRDNDLVNHPNHYQGAGGAECLNVVRGLPWSLGCATKYLWRYRGKGTPLQDLKKAEFYMRDFISSYVIGSPIKSSTQTSTKYYGMENNSIQREDILLQAAWLYCDNQFKESKFLELLDLFLEGERLGKSNDKLLCILGNMLTIVQELIKIEEG